MTEHPLRERIADLERRKAEAYQAGAPHAIKRQHDKGKLLARERIDFLLDPGSFHELDLLARHRAHAAGLEERPYTDGVITGWGTIDGRKVFVFSQDFTVFGGALGEVFAEKIHKLMDLALKVGAPVIGLNDGAGARIQEGVVSLAPATAASSTATCSPRASCRRSRSILGPCAGGAVYSPAMTDFIFMVARELAHVHHRPRRGEDGDRRGGHARGARRRHEPRHEVGRGHVRGARREGVPRGRALPPRLPAVEQPRGAAARSRRATTPSGSARRSSTSCPPASNKPYDMKKVITTVVDDGEFFEYFPHWAGSIVCGFARIDGHPVGIVGNQPMVLAGVLDIESSEKAARFVRTCDAFNIPLVTFVDVPGFLPGVDQEYGGIIRHGAKLLYAYCEATVPRIQVITRKAYGGAYVVMNSKSIGADLAFAWPTAELAVMGPQGAVEIVYRRELQQAADPVARRAELVDEYTEKFANPYARPSAATSTTSSIPAETRVEAGRRPRACCAPSARSSRKRKHGNMPL